MNPARGTALRGAAFLMATSAIGPGFLTQTAFFTSQLGASFGFAILCSIAVDLVAQGAIWRVLVAGGLRAPALADAVAPGAGRVLVLAVALGGFAFNIGNVAGAGLGLEAALGWPTRTGAALSAALAIALVLAPDATRAMDRAAVGCGLVLIGLMLAIALAARPPLGEAALRSVVPVRVDPLAILTIVGGTVGGYITFAGAHRLLDAGIQGPAALGEATRAAVRAIVLASVMRVLLFLAALGVLAPGPALEAANPAADVFRRAAGPLGARTFGVVMWLAAITSVVGAAWTSVTFLRSVVPAAARRPGVAVGTFIAASALVFLLLGRPVTLLVAAGAVNGFVLPIGLGLAVAYDRRQPAAGRVLPGWLALGALLVTVLLALLGTRELWRALASLRNLPA